MSTDKSKLLAALKAFGDSVTDCRADNAVLPWPPMLPYVHPAYWNGGRRFFYIGRDTFGWDLGGGGFSDFFDKYDQGDLAGYLAMNATALPLEKRVAGWAGWTGSFWHVMNLLHLRIRLGKIVDEMSAPEILAEMGYGNLNSIELPESLKQWKESDLKGSDVKLYLNAHAKGVHEVDFVDAVYEGRDPACPVEIGHRSATICHLANIAARLGRTSVKWDPTKERIVGDDEANARLFVKHHNGWTV